MAHDIQWVAPPPFWGRSPDASDARRTVLRRPALLRFATDSFMEEFQRTLEQDPSRLLDLEATYETWRGPASSDAVVPERKHAAPVLMQKLERLRVASERRLARASGTAVLEAPASTTGASSTSSGSTSPARLLKLYQPAHQRFYLVAASLVCRVPGLPDRAIDAARQQRAAFVIRRVRTESGKQVEYGFVPAPGGSSWSRISDPEHAVAAHEEKLPLFAVNFRDDAGSRRRVMAGLVPAGRREAYVGASLAETTTGGSTTPSVSIEAAGGSQDPGGPEPPVDPRIVLLTGDVIEPWKTLVARAEKARQGAEKKNNDGGSDADDARNAIRTEARDSIQVGSWYILLDFAQFLRDHLNPVFLALNSTSPSLTGKPLAVWQALNQTTLPTALKADLQQQTPSMTVKSSLREALAAIGTFGPKLEAADGFFQHQDGPGQTWPNFLFPLADPTSVDGVVPPLTITPSTVTTTRALRKISALRDLIAAALPSTPTAPVPDLPLAAQKVFAPEETARFVIRCVLERPDCDLVKPMVISAPSREFELASFFDPQAPARPIRIALPVDTSPAGLRRAPKNTAFMVSDMLCGQIARAKGLGFIDLVLSVLPWPLHKDLPKDAPSACKSDGESLGMICSLSIPIITICALILLIIIVTLLDIIFRWVPYFIFCFPLPKFSAKPVDAQS